MSRSKPGNLKVECERCGIEVRLDDCCQFLGKLSRDAERVAACKNYNAPCAGERDEGAPDERTAAVAYVFALFDGDRDAIEDAFKARIIQTLKLDAAKRAAIAKSVAEFAARNPELFEDGEDEEAA
jgi:hypothetical protein